MGKKDVLSTFFYMTNPPNSRNGSTPLIWKAWQKGNWWGNYKSKQQTQQLLRRRLDNALCKEEKRGEKPGSAGEVVERRQRNTARGEVVRVGEHAWNGMRKGEKTNRPALPSPGSGSTPRGKMTPREGGKGTRAKWIAAVNSAVCFFFLWLVSLASL